MVDITTLSMTEIIRLQNDLSQELKRRFEKPRAIAFSDIVGSTQFFGRLGDEAGRQLQQRHYDRLQRSIEPFDGRIVDTAGDGAFLCFLGVDAAVSAMVAFMQAVMDDNALRASDRQMVVRVGIHWATVLTDGVHVSGDAVNLCARVSASASPGEIRLTRGALQEIPGAAQRLRWRPLGPVTLKGIERPIELLAYEIHDRGLFPTHVFIQESECEVSLPDQVRTSFGRVGEESTGLPGNDIVLVHPDPNRAMKVSRWHFELLQKPDGLFLRQLSEKPTEVDGVHATKGNEVSVRPGTVVKVAGVLTLVFSSPKLAGHPATADQTIPPKRPGA